MADGQMAKQIDTSALNLPYSTQKSTNTMLNISHDRDPQSLASCPHFTDEATLIPSPNTQYVNSPLPSIKTNSNPSSHQTSNDPDGKFPAHASPYSPQPTGLYRTPSQSCPITSIMDRARLTGPSSLLHNDHRR